MAVGDLFYLDVLSWKTNVLLIELSCLSNAALYLDQTQVWEERKKTCFVPFSSQPYGYPE